jgi:hypothetical protein
VAIEPSGELPVSSAKTNDSSEFMAPMPVIRTEASHLPSPKLDWSHGLPCAAMGGFLALFLSFLPFFLFGPAFLAAGAFAVYLYYRRTHTGPNRGAAARLGAASGAFAFLFLSVVIVATVVYMPVAKREATVAQIRDATLARLRASHYDPDQIRSTMDFVNTQEGLVLGLVLSLLLLALICVVGASIGGAWYAAWLQKRERR